MHSRRYWVRGDDTCSRTLQLGSGSIPGIGLQGLDRVADHAQAFLPREKALGDKSSAGFRDHAENTELGTGSRPPNQVARVPACKYPASASAHDPLLAQESMTASHSGCEPKFPQMQCGGNAANSGSTVLRIQPCEIICETMKDRPARATSARTSRHDRVTCETVLSLRLGESTPPESSACPMKPRSISGIRAPWRLPPFHPR